MSEQTPLPASGSSSLPDAPNLDWLRKQAKRTLSELRKTNPAAKLAGAQFDLAKQYGFSSWRALKAHIDGLTVDGQLFDAAKNDDARALAALLDDHPEKLQARNKPYEHTLLHVAAFAGRLENVDLLLRRGLDVNAREKGDNTYAMHWAAAAGHLDVVRRLADAGGDVVGHGDDHELEVIGWASTWDGGDDAAHRAVANFLVSRGARHHIFSAIAFNMADEVRGIVASDPSSLNERQSHNENFRVALHFAVLRNRPEMVALLLELGADPLATDGMGHSAAAYATQPDVDRSMMEMIRARVGTTDLFTDLALGDWDSAARILRENPDVVKPGGVSSGVLHLMAKRNNIAAVKWLLEHGVDPSARWNHWDAEVTSLHLAILGGHPEVVRVLLAAGADPSIRDTQHKANAIEWAEFFGQKEIVRMLTAHEAKSK
jgi:ankyrin repeat protein